MGLVLDSGVLIAAERERRPIDALLATIEEKHGDAEVVLSALSIMELEHGLHRVVTAEQAQRRRLYLASVMDAIPVHPFTVEMARIAARVDAVSRKAGHVIPALDLLIGATALHFGYAVGTSNVRHFRMIPDLAIVQL
jgi:predicted nucleic acid-binding protein